MSADVRLPTTEVLGTHISYRSAGDVNAPVALFLHGNPTSSYIWRDILPGVSRVARCIAPDLVGFGQSGKPAIEYRFADHARYLDAFLDALGITSAYLVGQDWGTALAFDLAARRPKFVTGMAFMEFIRPMTSWAEFHQVEGARETFRKFRTTGLGEQMILQGNAFVEKVLPGSIVRHLMEDEMDTYRAPFPTPESRIPIWRLANELPIEGEPADVWERLSSAHEALLTSNYPKVLFAGDPGALVSPDRARSFAAELQNCRVVELGASRHYLQEDHPEMIAREVASDIEQRVAVQRDLSATSA